MKIYLLIIAVCTISFQVSLVALAADYQEKNQRECVIETIDAIQITESVIDDGNLFSADARISYDTEARIVRIQTVTGISPHRVGEWAFKSSNGNIGFLTNTQFIDIYEVKQ